MAATVILAMTAFAQPPLPPQGQGRPDGMPPMFGQFEQKDPAQMAQEETDRLNELVGLSQKQYKKIYKFNKRQYDQMQSKRENAMPQGFPGGRPDGMGPGGPRGGQRPDMGQGRPRMGGEMQEMMQEMKANKEKKYRKVLTPEQYQKWESFEAERDFRRMIER